MRRKNQDVMILVCMILIIIFDSSFVVRGLRGAVQIVKPTGDGGLEVIGKALEEVCDQVTEAMRQEGIENLAIISVVGPYHSGKSFLLNQLVGQQKGFVLGPSVEPQTRGLWIWSEPILLPEENKALLFLDTEGFYAKDVSEEYDAKIFAVATLLSSTIIYNSVKI